MFHICSAEGVVYSGYLEKLKTAELVSGLIKSQDSHDALLSDRPKLDIKIGYQPSELAIRRYKKALKDAKAREPIYHAGQIMTQGIASIFSEEQIAKSIKILQDSSFFTLPVVDQDGRLLGCLDKYDVVHLSEFQQQKLVKGKQLGLIDYLKKRNKIAITADPVTDIRRVAKVIIQYNVKLIPIVEETGLLVDIITKYDVVNCVANEPQMSLWS